MNKLAAATAAAAVFLAAPLAARAELGLRLGGEADVAYHDNGGTHFLTSNWPLGADLMLSYWTPGELVSLDAEIAELFYLNPPGTGQGSGPVRIGTVFRPGIRISPPVLPIYLRGAIPINLDSNAPYSSFREKYGLRLGAGITIPLVLFKVYLEGDADFPLGGGGIYAPGAFSNWNLVFNGGLDFRF